MLTRRQTVAGFGALPLVAGLGGRAEAQEVVKIGLILPMTGQSASTGRQIEAAAKLYMAQNGQAVAGRRIELIVRDDTGAADVTRRIAQELIVNEKVAAIGGFGLTPLAFAAAPLATQSKTPMIVMAAATSAITEQSPFIVRTSFTLPQATQPIADWAAKNNIRKVISLVTDYAPGIDAEKAFKERFGRTGGEVTAEVRVPLRNPDFAPFLQRVADAKPDALFVFVPSGIGGQFVKQFVERGLDKAGVKLIGTGDVTDDDLLNDMGDAIIGVVTSHHYSAAHNSSENRAFVQAFRAANPNMRPNFMAVGGYDGMHLFYEALKKTNGATDGQGLIDAMKGMSWVSPRGPITIEARTRDITQNVYVRRVEKVDGQLYNVEFDTFEAVPDPIKGR
ncbi:ABC transporter substrate-binding protein [Phreatobacter sp. AB_2022a]|uniref:ABC transporter substrate-binding protein n=1 Tax=Phreatobacter sp. AB_2022a TaxID=3003134 RepID=UPI002286E004|nr:ABC transporter substrate-binding protein [Phreatobacter sp. AB_2022a]MCZ0732899.1 ABC transporter substrate-binding protein [Phreatobacter sp. AB_2022a]